MDETPLRQKQELTPDYNTGIIIALPEDKDFIAGVNSPLVTAAIVEPTKDWRPYVSTLEKQSSPYLETDNCTGYSYTNDVEDQINRMILKGTIAQEFLQFLKDNQYLDDNGLVNTSERALGAMAGTGPNGNRLDKVCETARTMGLAPNKMWAWDPNVQKTYESYYAMPPANVLAIAKKFLEYVDLPYHWITTSAGYPGLQMDALQYAPLYSALVTCGGWGNPPVAWCNADPAACNHAVVTVSPAGQNNGFTIQDSYLPANGLKELATNYIIPYTMQVMAIQKKTAFPPLYGVKVASNQTVFVRQDNGVCVPVASWAAYVEIGGSSQTIKTISDADFAKLPKVTDVMLNK